MAGKIGYGGKDLTSTRRTVRTSLEAEALRLRRDGHGFDEIAEILGVKDEQAAYYLVKAALDRKGKPEADQLRQQMLDNLDVLANRAIRIAKSDRPDSVSAINAAVNVYNRMAALSGADAPKKVDVTDERQLPPDAASRQKFLERLAEEARSKGSEGS